MEEAATPFPNEETTPPVTKIYFGAIRDGPRTESRTYPPSAGDVQGIMDAAGKRVKREMPWNGIRVSMVLIFEWNFCSIVPEVCGVGRIGVARPRGSRRMDGELNAGNELHLQLYFFCSVFLTRARCVSGVVCVLRDGLA